MPSSKTKPELGADPKSAPPPVRLPVSPQVAVIRPRARDGVLWECAPCRKWWNSRETEVCLLCGGRQGRGG